MPGHNMKYLPAQETMVAALPAYMGGISLEVSSGEQMCNTYFRFFRSVPIPDISCCHTKYPPCTI